MNESVIYVEKLPRRFTIGKRGSYATFRGTIARKLAASPRAGANGNSGTEVLWALNDISFGVKRGEVVSLIGRNGGGKTAPWGYAACEIDALLKAHDYCWFRILRDGDVEAIAPEYSNFDANLVRTSK